ncbi:Glycoside hydrolase family 5 protein [Mycena venus]|uniref:glucan 1,3-beta-glucosidase n=1 Tax=Mycena venus TaxID=2733690 RepID=A0A8H7D5I9_9AGAR|nr:Glycoside hydrolase family 5 protein [Mycena venus]
MMQERQHGGDPFVSSPYYPSQGHGNSLDGGMSGGYSDLPPVSHSQGQAYTPYGQETPYAASDAQLGAPHGAYRDDPSSTYPPASPNASGMLLPARSFPHDPPSSSKRRKMILLGLLALIVVAAAVVIPLYFLVIKKHNDKNAASNNGTSAKTGGKAVVGAVSGGDGSTVTTANGETFVYNNSFGGYWLADPANPFLTGAKPNSWTPALNETWTWGVDRIYGVNLGGWFVLEPSVSARAWRPAVNPSGRVPGQQGTEERTSSLSGALSPASSPPPLFQPYPFAPDEWTLAALMRADGSPAEHDGEALRYLYCALLSGSPALANANARTQTEQDIAAIAGAGLNWVRVPIPFWSISSWSDVGTDSTGAPVAEPFLEGRSGRQEAVCLRRGRIRCGRCKGTLGGGYEASMGAILDAGRAGMLCIIGGYCDAGTYIVRLFGWARKYGIRVNLDLHTAPGSQNGYNHSGKLGQINFLNGPMGFANAQRMLDYIRVITEFISQPEYKDLIPMFGIVNEAYLPGIGRDVLTSFYLQAHNMIRGITGYGAGNGPFISIHDGFQGTASWAGFLPGSDRIILDTHPYFAFDGAPNNAPIATSLDPLQAGGPWPKQACSAWGPSLNKSRSAFGVTVAGEFSNGYNDCGLYLTGVNGTQSYGGDCSLWLDASTWNDTTKAGVKQFALASMDATQDWFFWTWKIGPAANGTVSSPLWSYSLGLENGFMPTDPRDSHGVCAALGVDADPFVGTFSSWQTGGAGAGTIAPTALQSFSAWPPATLSNVNVPATQLPTYTPTATIATLTFVTPTPTASGGGSVAKESITASVGNGWFDAQDQTPMMTSVAGCPYPDAWSAVGSAIPPPCTGTP